VSENGARGNQEDGRIAVMPTEFVKFHPGADANVIELKLPTSLESAEFDQLNDSLLSLLKDRSQQKWVIDLAAVSYMGSAMLGMLVNVRQQIKAGGGTLLLCGLSKPLLGIFKTCCMERLFTIVKDRQAAVAS
jgi:anti-anti-sigma factor